MYVQKGYWIVFLEQNKHYRKDLLIFTALEKFQLWIIFQQDGALPHWGSSVRDFREEPFLD